MIRQSRSNKKQAHLVSIIQGGLVLFAVMVFAPFILFVLNTFKDKEHIYDTFHFPNLFYLENYRKVFETTNFFQSLSITIIISCTTLFFVVIFSSMAGYAINRTKYKSIQFLYILLVAGQIIPPQTSMIPLYKLGVATQMINTVPFLVLIYVSRGCAFATILIAGFTKTIPKALEDAAFIDGCGKLKTFYLIIFPLLRPAIATIVATTIYWYWNDFQTALIYLNSGRFDTLMMSIFRFMGSNNTVDWGPVYALCLLASIPMIIFFLLTQKLLLQGLVVGSVKG